VTAVRMSCQEWGGGEAKQLGVHCVGQAHLIRRGGGGEGSRVMRWDPGCIAARPDCSTVHYIPLHGWHSMAWHSIAWHAWHGVAWRAVQRRAFSKQLQQLLAGWRACGAAALLSRLLLPVPAALLHHDSGPHSAECISSCICIRTCICVYVSHPPPSYLRMPQGHQQCQLAQVVQRQPVASKQTEAAAAVPEA
jgi:hypothetical protein